MNKIGKQEWARLKSRRQAERRKPTHYQSDTPMNMLRNFLPELPSRLRRETPDQKVLSDALSRLRREPEREVSFWFKIRLLWLRIKTGRRRC